MIIHIPTGKKFENRLQAKLEMGSSNYQKAYKKGEIKIIDYKEKETPKN